MEVRIRTGRPHPSGVLPEDDVVDGHMAHEHGIYICIHIQLFITPGGWELPH